MLQVKLEAVCVTISSRMIVYHSLLHSSILAVNDDFVLVFSRLRLCQGTNNNNVQSLVVDINDDSEAEGTESFIISGDATAPASFVPGRDSAIVNILDNDGAWLVYAQSSRFICCVISSHTEYESRYCLFFSIIVFLYMQKFLYNLYRTQVLFLRGILWHL